MGSVKTSILHLTAGPTHQSIVAAGRSMFISGDAFSCEQHRRRYETRLDTIAHAAGRARLENIADLMFRHPYFNHYWPFGFVRSFEHDSHRQAADNNVTLFQNDSDQPGGRWRSICIKTIIFIRFLGKSAVHIFFELSAVSTAACACACLCVTFVRRRENKIPDKIPTNSGSNTIVDSKTIQIERRKSRVYPSHVWPSFVNYLIN